MSKLLATFCGDVFFRAALYISLVQHPAALETGQDFAVRFFQYRTGFRPDDTTSLQTRSRNSKQQQPGRSAVGSSRFPLTVSLFDPHVRFRTHAADTGSSRWQHRNARFGRQFRPVLYARTPRARPESTRSVMAHAGVRSTPETREGFSTVEQANGVEARTADWRSDATWTNLDSTAGSRSLFS